MDIRIEEKGDLYSVCVKIPKYDVRVKRNTSRVLSEAKKLGYELGEVVESAYLHNLNGVIEGTWIFKKKVVDKPVKPVILKEEKSVQPKPKRQRRTRSSTKKVSTEE